MVLHNFICRLIENATQFIKVILIGKMSNHKLHYAFIAI